ncbi:type III-A CRISPR-associated RAMP protein Csm3 [Robertmurraya siralis]|uniref:Type III-A CRISPR-associated RAMP protein Csm3 n=1 Tax=Robertmurraya siralis TaxID=77777 RepID=A0A920BVY1_9BACI|nr:RAMP superfamily CRISPR-associated protein [Robertmurraya siralis]GIN63877.1 type III-A CRISPR-associated RAMP protein Csm3 [Robertmurraya siralis]
MTVNTLYLKVTTFSNLFIGGSPKTFEIGGIDLFTVTDHEGNPYIPASSFKGSLRRIVREMYQSFEEAELITQAYKAYLLAKKQENLPLIKEMKEKDEFDRVEKRYEEAIHKSSAEYLFGIEGFNHTPKLIFNDFRLLETNVDPFSIDSKNSIEVVAKKKDNLVANPRIYKTVRPGVEFSGEIHFYMVNQLQLPTDIVAKFIKKTIDQFNTGVYRLGNSGSRGYGRVQVEVSQEGNGFE